MRKYLSVTIPVLGLFLLVSASLWTTGCKPKKVELPPPPPTPTPVLPPGSLVFVQRGHLVRLDLDSSQLTPLTSGKSTEWFPACSPKGDQLVYWSNSENPNSGVYNLWRINLDGSDRVQLTFDGVNLLPIQHQNLLINNAPSWSVDGKHILYTLNGDIWTMDPDGYNPETLLVGHEALSPIFSPDGKTVVFLSNQDDPVYNLWVYTLGEKSLKKLTNYTDWSVGSPSFSMDGRKILFNLYRSNTTQVYTMGQDGGNPLNLTNNNRSLCPKFAQNDRKIVYAAYGTGEDIDINIYIANSNGTESKALTTQSGSSPTWAPARILVQSAVTPVASPAAK